MTTRIWVWGAVIVVILGAGVWYFMSNAGGSSTVAGDQSATSTASTAATSGQVVSGAGTTSGSSTIGELLALNANLQCSVTLSTGGTQSQGMIYLSAGGKMHGDFSTTENGNVINSTTINDGTNVYSWTNLSTQGYEATVAVSNETGGAAAHGGVDNSTAVNYSCKTWSPDQTEFVPPTNITF